MKNILTERERNVLIYLTQGLTNNEIADKLHISVHTVKAHLEAIYDKLAVTNRVQASIKSIINNLVDLNTIV